MRCVFFLIALISRRDTWQALLGFDRNLTHLDGHIVRLHRTGVTQPSFVQTITGEGMPIYGRSFRGDLFVEYNVVLPVELSPQLRRSKCLGCVYLVILRLPTFFQS